jgi:hypothetical protein
MWFCSGSGTVGRKSKLWLAEITQKQGDLTNGKAAAKENECA